MAPDRYDKEINLKERKTPRNEGKGLRKSMKRPMAKFPSYKEINEKERE